MEEARRVRRRYWIVAELYLLGKIYADTPTQDIATALGRGISGVYGMAAKLGLHKSAAYLASPAACRLRRGHSPASVDCRFKPGHVPANLGLRRPGWAPGRMAASQFKKGQIGNRRVPLGSTRFSKDGYLERKVREWSYPPHCWVGEHVLLWEKANGKVPDGHAVVFIDGDKTNIVIENLELISRGALMLRNSIHQLPKELVEVIQLKGALNHRITTLERKRTNAQEQN